MRLRFILAGEYRSDDSRPSDSVSDDTLITESDEQQTLAEITRLLLDEEPSSGPYNLDELKPASDTTENALEAPPVASDDADAAMSLFIRAFRVGA